MTASISRGHRFAQCLYLLLVAFLSIALQAKSPTGPSLADQFVTTTQAHAVSGGNSEVSQSVGSTPAPAVVDVGTGDYHPLDPALRLAREALARFDSTVDDYTGTIIKRERISGSLAMSLAWNSRFERGKKMVTKL